MRAKKLLVWGFINLCGFFPTFAQAWVPTGLSSYTWGYFAVSGDGNTLIASPFYPKVGVIISTNGGADWHTNTLPVYFPFGNDTPFNISLTSVTCSTDGRKMAGVYVGGIICTSTNSGATWVTNDVPLAGWYSIAGSADGIKLVAAAGNSGSSGPIYTSTNSGLTWQPTTAPSNNWRCVASSADGVKLVAGASYSIATVFVSTNSGITWFDTGLPTNSDWTVACSSDGNKMIAVNYSNFSDPENTQGRLFTSTDAGTTWELNPQVSGFFGSVAMSADGNKVFIVSYDGSVYVSTNFGANWTINDLPDGEAFVNIAASADGGKLLTGSVFSSDPSGNGVSYFSSSVYAPQINLERVSTNVALSWFLPSANFVLQQSSDFADWSDSTNRPLLNLTNLQNQITLPLNASNRFYRLKTP